MARAMVRRVGIGVALGVLAGLLLTLGLGSGAQTGGSTEWQDKTFALAQHPSTLPVGQWLPFDFGHKNDRDRVIWDSGDSGRCALVSVYCDVGEINVEWDGDTIRLDATGSAAVAAAGRGNVATVYSSRVELDVPSAWAGTVPKGRYIVTVDISD